MFNTGNHDANLNADMSDIGVHFFDLARNTEVVYPIQMAAENILNLDLNHDYSWIIFVPGFNSPYSGRTNEKMRDAMKTLDRTYYVQIDHYVYTSADQSYLKNYDKSVALVNDLGNAVAEFLTDLHNSGIPIHSIRCIGHSLGSQILGVTGFSFKAKTGKLLKRITALDPAGPCFSKSFIENQVRSGAAEYVEVFHCNAGAFGSKSVLGDVDFFANNRGESQPHCHVPLIPGFLDSAKAAKCSHDACVDIYTATVYHKEWFPAKKCESYGMFKRGECDGETLAGFWGPSDAYGVYYFSTEGFAI